jgi:hypothetical protein
MSPKTTVTASDVERYETLRPLIESLHEDVKELTRKSQSIPLSKVKVQMINRLLAQVKKLLQPEPTAAFLDLLEEDLLPQNADALLVLGQHKAALDQYHEKYTDEDQYNEDQRTWRIRGR